MPYSLAIPLPDACCLPPSRRWRLPAPTRANAEAQLLIEAATGKVLHAENATYPWYPASVTKLMTAYTTLRAIKDGRIGMNTLLTVSRNAAAQQPTKMGFKVGTTRHRRQCAEDADGEVGKRHGGGDRRRRRRLDRGFADMMNANARRLGMTQSNFVNPNGLPAENHVTSARDLGILARALITRIPRIRLSIGTSTRSATATG